MKRVVVSGLLLVASISLNACDRLSITQEQQNTAVDTKQRELDLKEKELELREKELQLKEKEANNNNLSDLYKKLSKSIFTVYAVDGDENVSQGTAFIIDPSGIALSNYHVFENAAVAVAVNGAGDKFVISEVLDYDKDTDYFLFRLAPYSSSFIALPLALQSPDIGQNCFAIGNPEGLTNTLTKGIISGFRKNDSWIQTDTAITHGSSGGPLFNDKGEVIGITSKGLEGQGLNFAVNIQKIPIREFLNRTIAINSDGKFDAREFIHNYYAILLREDFDNLYPLFADKIQRYYSKFNPEKSWVINDIQAYKKRFKVNSVSYLIDESSIKSFLGADGNNTIEFEMDYKLDRQEKDKPSDFHLKMFMAVNQEGKIVSIYEDILSKF